MTLDPELETITFWETTKNENYELKGRITSNKEERKKLKFLLSGKDLDAEKGNSEFFGYCKMIKYYFILFLILIISILNYEK